ncbi:hypothetical protein Bca52824_024473 [Brassica carinata]|uniref:Uncharacterized protein n=1 Tax=Brassica carinata TaxID=52824 RepID=A0A8X7VKD1_BRACI|nr:hypothetical protein Bca52824_024473 [Brassica carinata]
MKHTLDDAMKLYISPSNNIWFYLKVAFMDRVEAISIAPSAISRWNDTETKPSMLLLTTLNSTILGGGVTLSSTDSPRLFIDSNVCVTEKYLSRCGADGDATPAIKNSSTVIKSCDEPYAIYWFEVKVCDDGGDEETFVSFDKTALKLVGRQSPFVMNVMRAICIINKCNIRYP